MDRTTWIVVTLCVIGLVLWEIYVANQTRPKPAPATGAPPATFSPPPGVATSTATPALAAATPTPQPAETVAPFPAQTETLRNSDLELHLTNRGGGIAEAVLLNHVAEENSRVTLNSADHPPVGAIIDNAAAPSLPERTSIHPALSSALQRTRRRRTC